VIGPGHILPTLGAEHNLRRVSVVVVDEYSIEVTQVPSPQVTTGALHPIETTPFEAVERKGLGHPDTIADLVAETFSARYLRAAIDKYGVPLNHWVDKVTLVGASASVRLGGYDITKPIEAYLFGKVTPGVGSEEIGIPTIFQASVVSVLKAATRDERILDVVDCRVRNTRGLGTDHEAPFYAPLDRSQLLRPGASEATANDSVIASAYAPLSRAERLTIQLERVITGPILQNRFPPLGTDVKVLTTRTGSDYEVIVCFPILPDLVATLREYRELRRLVHVEIRDCANAILASLGQPKARTTVRVNGKDGRDGAYLAPFGTSLGKGDVGVVGRGNRTNGVISPLRGLSVDADAGKNPMNHTGKLYNVAADRIATRIALELGIENRVVLVSRAGLPLERPAHVAVELAVSHSRPPREVHSIVMSELERLKEYASEFAGIDPVARFKDPEGYRP
jgi:S-adenosylmethionine synthetase